MERIPILKMGRVLLVTIQVDMHDRLALALQSLVASKFPQDTFHIVGFSDYARVLQPTELAGLSWDMVQGTNLQHALIIASRHLAQHPDVTGIYVSWATGPAAVSSATAGYGEKGAGCGNKGDRLVLVGLRRVRGLAGRLRGSGVLVDGGDRGAEAGPCLQP